MSQTSYVLDSPAAVAGQLADLNDARVGSAVAASTLYPGRLAVFDSNGKLEHPSVADLTTKVIAGVVLRVPVREQAVGGGSATWAAGEVVPFCMEGEVMVSFNGGTQSTKGQKLKVKHASTDGSSNLQHIGKFTVSAGATAAGTEVTDPGCASVVKLLPSADLSTVAWAHINVDLFNL